MNTPRYTNDQIVEALKATFGKVYLAAEKLGCQPSTVYRRAERSRLVAETIEHYSGRMLDVAETALNAALLNREAWAIRFALQTAGRKRGYNAQTPPTPPVGEQYLWKPRPVPPAASRHRLAKYARTPAEKERLDRAYRAARNAWRDEMFKNVETVETRTTTERAEDPGGDREADRRREVPGEIASSTMPRPGMNAGESQNDSGPTSPSADASTASAGRSQAAPAPSSTPTNPPATGTAPLPLFAKGPRDVPPHAPSARSRTISIPRTIPAVIRRSLSHC